MNTPLGTPIRQAKLNLASKSLPIASEFKKLLNEQHQRLSSKHQQDLDLIDDIRAYTKSRLSIERDYTSALSKLTKQHSAHIAKKFTLLNQCESDGSELGENSGATIQQSVESSESKLHKRLANTASLANQEEPEEASSLYRVWSEHIRLLAATSKHRADQFEQLVIVVDKLKDIRGHKASIGKKSLDNHLRKIHEDLIASMIDLDKAKKLYYEDESQAKKARENEEKIRKKRSGLLNKFTDLQAKKEKTSAQREANDIQSTQARNDYIMALAAANAHLKQYYFRDLNDFIRIIDDGILDHCKVFMATLSECDINSLKFSLRQGQFWSKMINLTNSQRTNSIFLESAPSSCLRRKNSLPFEACNEDPIQSISLEYNADYALQHEIDKWFTWFKKECRNLSQLMHSLEQCQRAAAEGRKTIELNGQSSEDLESKITELKQQIRKSEAAKLKAQARLKVIKEGGMQIEEWGAVEQEIRADMARAQELEMETRRSKELATRTDSNEIEETSEGQEVTISGTNLLHKQQQHSIHLHISSDNSDEPDSSMHNLASVIRSPSNVQQPNIKQTADYSALADPTLAWQDDPSSAWGSSSAQVNNYNVVVTGAFGSSQENQQGQFDANNNFVSSSVEGEPHDTDQAYGGTGNRYDLLSAQQQDQSQQHIVRTGQTTSMTVQSSSPLSAIMDVGGQRSASPYPGLMGEAYKSDYECDYNRTTDHLGASSAGSAGIDNSLGVSNNQQSGQTPTGKRDADLDSYCDETNEQTQKSSAQGNEPEAGEIDVFNWLNRRVVALYSYDGSNEDDLPFAEGDILLILEVNDYDWARAYHESNQSQGFIPTSYVKLLPDEQSSVEEEASKKAQEAGDFADELEASSSGQMQETIVVSEDGRTSTNAGAETLPEFGLCRALYDYEPEKEGPEEDGWPQLRLKHGELLKIVDTDENDGWWLVERESTGERGHVHSILVEEFDPNQSEDDDDEDEEFSQGSDYEPNDATSIKAMPTFEPPKPAGEDTLGKEQLDELSQKCTQPVERVTINVKTSDELEQPNTVDGQVAFDNTTANDMPVSNEIDETAKLEQEKFELKTESPGEQADARAESKQPQQTNKNTSNVGASQLVPTSFIIIEPTPDVERRDIEESFRERLAADERSQDSQDSVEWRATQRTVIKCDDSVPPKDVCYSIVDEQFAFDEQPRPPKKVTHDRSQAREAEQQAVYSDQPSPDSLFDQSNVNPIYKNKADDFSRQIIDQAIGFAYGISAQWTHNK